MYIDKNILLENCDIKNNKGKIDIMSLFEADQSKMGAAQRAKDIKRRQNAQTVGFEIEMYSDIDVDSARRYLNDFPGLEGLVNVVHDSSLSDGTADIDYEYEPSLCSSTARAYIGGSSVSAGDMLGVAIDDIPKFAKLVDDFIANNIGKIKACIELIEELDVDEDDDHAKDSSLQRLNTIIDGVSPVDYADGLVPYGGDISAAARDIRHIGTFDAKEIADAIFAISFDIERDEIGEAPAYAIAAAIYEEGEELAAVEYLLDQSRFVAEDISDRFYDEFARADGMSGEGDRYGIELVTNKPIPLRGSDKIIKALVNACNDATINAEMQDGTGSTGLHIHYGISPTIEHNLLDIIRLIVNTDNRQDEINDAAGRVSDEWADNMSHFIESLEEKISELESLFSEYGKINTVSSFNALVDNRYYGVNLVNLLNEPGKKNTIEFRWASSTICKEYESFKAYMDLLNKIVFDSYTGATEMEFRGYTLRTTKSLEFPSEEKIAASPVINVFKGDTLIGKIQHTPIHIKGESSRSVKLTDKMTKLKNLATHFGKESEEYKSALAEVKKGIRPKKKK